MPNGVADKEAKEGKWDPSMRFRLVVAADKSGKSKKQHLSWCLDWGNWFRSHSNWIRRRSFSRLLRLRQSQANLCNDPGIGQVFRFTRLDEVRHLIHFPLRLRGLVGPGVKKV